MMSDKLSAELTGSGTDNFQEHLSETVNRTVAELCRPESYDKVYFRDTHDVSMPSPTVLREVVEQLRSVLFPGYYGASELTPSTMPYYIGSTLIRISRFLSDQFTRGFCVSCFHETSGYCIDCHQRSKSVAERFIESLPRIRELLASDVQAAFDGDPATENMNEVIFCYPSIKALTSFRIAHQLFLLGVPLLPRIITELAHSETGIDIHPGAQIGKRCFIDHGTGTVIGATCIIGNNVRIYQGVTLGAKSFTVDEEGKLVKGIARHPLVEDDVTIYAGATILGRVTIGKGSVVGGNVWLTSDVPPNTLVTQRQPKQIYISQTTSVSNSED